jgi:hypothetical protein
VRKLTKGLVSFFLHHRRSKEKNKAYIRAQKLLKHGAFSSSQTQILKSKSDFLRATQPQPRECVFLQRSANFGDSVERISSHARTRKPLSPSRILKPCRSAGRPAREAVVCNLFIAVVSASRVRWLILAPLPNHRPIHRPVCRC